MLPSLSSPRLRLGVDDGDEDEALGEQRAQDMWVAFPSATKAPVTLRAPRPSWFAVSTNHHVPVLVLFLNLSVALYTPLNIQKGR